MLGLGQWAFGWLDSMLLPMARLSAVFLVSPLFPQVAVMQRLRVTYALLICLAVLPAGSGTTFESAGYLGLAMEVALGLMIGLTLQLVLAATTVAGEQISMALGLGFAQAFDPSSGTTPVIAQFLNLLAMLVFMAAGGHLLVIQLLAETMRSLPPGSLTNLEPRALLDVSGLVFLGAGLLAAPLLLAMMAVNIGVGALSRATPALNVFSIGFAVNLIVGFSLLYLLLPVMADRMQQLWSQAIGALMQFSGLDLR